MIRFYFNIINKNIKITHKIKYLKISLISSVIFVFALAYNQVINTVPRGIRYFSIKIFTYFSVDKAYNDKYV